MGFEIGSQTVVSHAGLSRILWDNTCSLAVFIKNIFLLLQRMPIYDKKIWINFFEAELTLEIFKNLLQWSSMLKNWNSPGLVKENRFQMSQILVCFIFLDIWRIEQRRASNIFCKSLVNCVLFAYKACLKILLTVSQFQNHPTSPLDFSNS